MTTALRAHLESTGQHIGAIRRLGETYSAEEYLLAAEAARDAGDGSAYADAVLGEQDDGEAVENVDEDVHTAALADLKERGIHDPSYQQLAAALLKASDEKETTP